MGVRKGDVLGRWTLTEYIDSGGNGDVWFVPQLPRAAVAGLMRRRAAKRVWPKLARAKETRAA